DARGPRVRPGRGSRWARERGAARSSCQCKRLTRSDQSAPGVNDSLALARDARDRAGIEGSGTVRAQRPAQPDRVRACGAAFGKTCVAVGAEDVLTLDLSAARRTRPGVEGRLRCRQQLGLELQGTLLGKCAAG